MNDTLYKMLEPTNTIEQALPKIMQAFIDFYGEENREYIENKFNNLLIVGYGLPDKIDSILSEIKRNIKEELIEKFFDELNIALEKRNEFKNILFSNYDFEYLSLIPLQKYIDYKEISKDSQFYDSKKKSALEFLKQINPSINLENMEELEMSGVFSEIDELIPLYKNIIGLYNEEMKKLTKYIKQNEFYKQSKRQIFTSHYEQLLNEFSYLIPANEMEKLKQNGVSSIYNCPLTNSYLGRILTDTPIIDAFSLESEELLISGRDWQKDSIRRDRIEFFKSNGIDLGNDYEKYMNNSECQKIIPKEELIIKIKNRKKELEELALNLFYKSTEEYKYNRKRIDDKELLLKDDGYNANAYFNGATFVSPNISNKNGIFELEPIMCINTSLKEYIDKFVIHELNHVFELGFIKEQDGILDFVCGWDYLSGSINSTPELIEKLQENKKKREYELFSEIINELIAQEITALMHSNDIYIFNNKENAKDKGGTSYENTVFLIKDFYETYKKEIIESRKNGNIQILFDKVGEENFNSLNQLFHEYYKNFSGMLVYSLFDDLQANKDTELTRKYYELISKRDEILKSMNEYALEYSNSNKK